MRRYYNIIAEIVQVQNRFTLANFIIPYIEYAKRPENKDISNLLQPFNDIIFKPIVCDSKDIPKLLDSIPGVTELIEALAKFKK